jgi:katanin p80 WD40 repeat-containing subunit B1
MATGGEDKRVNLWAVGKPKAIASMTGHQSAVECVTFDPNEEVVVAGAAGGTIKLWDLEAARAARTLVGHRSNVVAVDFHPFGEFFASGSLDTNLKIWDVRRKGCVHTYKGHDRGVSVAKFSPDGKWVISGGQDGRVRLWDLTAGKCLKELPPHDGPVTSLEFHPEELLLATGSGDRTVKFWDLETFHQVDECVEATGIKSMIFTPDGSALLAGTSEFLKVWKWEPSTCRDAVDVSWKNLQDLSTREDKLIGASIQNSFVGVWVVDLNHVEPFHSGKDRGPGGGGTRYADRETRSKMSAEETAAAAVSAAAEFHRNKIDRVLREENGTGHPERARGARVPRNSSANIPFDPRDVASEDAKWDRENARRSPQAMNSRFAAAHGIAEDPRSLGDGHAKRAPPPLVVVAKPRPEPKPERRAAENRAVPSSSESARTVRSDRGRSSDDEEIEEAFENRSSAEDPLERVVSDGDDDDDDDDDDDANSRTPGLAKTSVPLETEPLNLPESTPTEDDSREGEPSESLSSPTKPSASATGTRVPFLSPSRTSPRKSFAADGNAFNLEALRSAALEADSEFIDAREGVASGSTMDRGDDFESPSLETFAGALARARAERARESNADSVTPITFPRARALSERERRNETRSPLGVDLAFFLPRAFGGGGEKSATPPTPALDESEVFASLSDEDGETVRAIFEARLAVLRETSRHWIRGDPRRASLALFEANDPSATFDVLSATLEAPHGGIAGDGAITLEIASRFVSLAGPLLRSKHHAYVDCALRFARRVCFAFEPALVGSKRREARAAAPARGIGVDVAGEERAERASNAREALLSQRDAIERLAVSSDAFGEDVSVKARELLDALERLA